METIYGNSAIVAEKTSCLQVRRKKVPKTSSSPAQCSKGGEYFFLPWTVDFQPQLHYLFVVLTMRGLLCGLGRHV